MLGQVAPWPVVVLPIKTKPIWWSTCSSNSSFYISRRTNSLENIAFTDAGVSHRRPCSNGKVTVSRSTILTSPAKSTQHASIAFTIKNFLDKDVMSGIWPTTMFKAFKIQTQAEWTCSVSIRSVLAFDLDVNVTVTSRWNWLNMKESGIKWTTINGPIHFSIGKTWESAKNLESKQESHRWPFQTANLPWSRLSHVDCVFTS